MSRTVVPAADELGHHLPRAPARFGVQPGRRLVEEQQLGVAVDRERDLEPALLAAGELLDGDVGLAREIEPVEVGRHVPAAAAQRRPQLGGLAHGQLAGEAAAPGA